MANWLTYHPITREQIIFTGPDCFRCEIKGTEECQKCEQDVLDEQEKSLLLEYTEQKEE